MVQVSDRIGIMLEGELVEVNDAQAIYRAPQHAYTRRLWASMPRLHGEQIGGEAAG
jgi:peptide/nickel transport system ATP-binding protein